MGASQQRKGKTGEREVARLLRDLLGTSIHRNLEQSRHGGCDLLGITGWSLEIKRAATPRLNEWWVQTCSQALASGQRPALLYRLNRQPWKAMLALRHVATGFENAPLSLRIETGLDEFAALVREFLHDGHRA